jgi:hypothetical protein
VLGVVEHEQQRPAGEGGEGTLAGALGLPDSAVGQADAASESGGDGIPDAPASAGASSTNTAGA